MDSQVDIINGTLTWSPKFNRRLKPILIMRLLASYSSLLSHSEIN